MKILQVCKKFPFPIRDGESIAITNLAKSLKVQGSEVHLLAMNTSRHFYQIKEDKLPAELDFYNSVKTVFVDNRIKIFGALRNLFSEESYHIERFISLDFSQELTTILSQDDFDVVQLETPYLAPYLSVIRKNSNALVVMRSHNVEYEIWERISKNTLPGPKRWYLKLLTKKLKRFEIKQLSQYDILAAITRRDLDKYRALGFSGEGTVIPVGFDPQDYYPNPDSFQGKQYSGKSTTL